MDIVRVLYKGCELRFPDPLALSHSCQLAAWNLKSRTPSSLDAALGLLSVIRIRGSVADSLAARHMYSQCISRILNSFINPMQRKTRAVSMHSLALSLGIPSWFVELRHNSGHGFLPDALALGEFMLKVCTVTRKFKTVNHCEGG